MHGHPFHAALRALGLIFATLLVGVVALAWTLSRGPVALTPLRPVIEQALDRALQDAGVPMRARVGDVVLTWRADAVASGGPAAGLEIDLHRTGVTDPDGRLLARLGRVAVDLDPGALLRGEVSLASLTLVGPAVRLIRGTDGTVSLDLATLAGARTTVAGADATLDTGPAESGPAESGPAESGPAKSGEPEAATDDAGSPLGGFSDATPQPSDAPSGEPSADLVTETPAEALLTMDDVLKGWEVLAGMGFAVRNARLSLTDEADGRVWSLWAEELGVRPQGDALLLDGSLRLSGQDAPAAALDVALRHRPGADLASLMIMVRDVNPARHLAPHLGLEALTAWHQTLSGTLAVDVDMPALAAWMAGKPEAPGAMLRFAHLSLQGGAGRVDVPPPVNRAYALRGLAVEASASPPAASPSEPSAAGILDVSHLRLDLDDGVSVTATARLEGLFQGPPSATVDLRLSPLDVPTLLDLWPGHVAHGGYVWIGKNLSGGGVGESRFSATLSGADWESLAVTALGGETWAKDLTVHYLGDLAPAQGGAGRLSFGLNDIVIDQITGTVDVDAGEGSGGTLSVQDGVVRLFDLDQAVEQADMTFQIAGPLPAALALIDKQPLGYATKVGITPGRARGQVDTTLRIALPLIKDVDIEALTVGVEAKASNVGLPAVALGQDLTDGNLSLALDNAGMDVSGRATLGGVPVSLTWRENFTHGMAFDRRYAVRGRVKATALARFGLKGPPFTPPWLSGPLDVDLTYTEAAGKPGRLKAEVDLTPATLAVSTLGWRKPPGIGGQASVTGRFDDHGMTVGFDLFAVPGQATVIGEARLTAAGDLRGITVSRLRLADTDVRVEVVAPTSTSTPTGGSGEPWRLALTGPTLDVRPLLESDTGDGAPGGAAAGGAAAGGAAPGGGADTARTPDKPPEKTPEKTSGETPGETPGTPLGGTGADSSDVPLDIRLQVDRLLLAQSITVDGADIALSRDGNGRWQRAQGDGRINGGPLVTLRLKPGDGGLRQFSLTTEDAGAVVRALGLNDNLRGGNFTLSGTMTDAGVIEGRLRAHDLFFSDAPVLVRLLAVASLTGILEELQGEGLWLNRLVVPFRYADPLLTLEEARANGPSLGLTASGDLNLDNETMDLTGAVVPAYLVNSLLGKIPVVGDLLVGEKGGGVFAVNYSADGPMDNPRISVNPLTLLTPGVLREVFGVLPDGSEDDTDTPAAAPVETVEPPSPRGVGRE